MGGGATNKLVLLAFKKRWKVTCHSRKHGGATHAPGVYSLGILKKILPITKNFPTLSLFSVARRSRSDSVSHSESLTPSLLVSEDTYRGLILM